MKLLPADSPELQLTHEELSTEDYMDRDAWERQPEESPRDYLMFSCYRDMHPLDRTVREGFIKYIETVSPHEIDHDPTRGHVPRWVVDLAAKNSWIARAKEYDDYCDKKKRAALEKAREEAVLQASRIGSLMRVKALEALKELLAIKAVEVIDPETGEKTYVISSALSAGDIVKLADAGIRIERDALGLNEPSKSTGTTLQIAVFNGPPPVDDGSLTDRARIVLAERAKLLPGNP